MIYIFSAFYAEAKNIIDHYGLKKEKSPETVRFDVFANDSIRLVITGVGEINAAAAVSNIGGAYGISPDDEILNVGCGAGFGNETCLGSIFLGNKLTEQMTGRTFYPDMLMKTNLMECEIVTVTRVLNEGCDSVVYDMEAAAVYQAAAFFVGPHRMHFIKLVSDAGERIDQSKITELFALQEEKICGYIDMLLSAGADKASIDKKTKGKNTAAESSWNMDRLISDMRCSKVMGDQLAQLIKYCRLSGIAYKAVLDEYYAKGLLPCESKREGKKCLFELKQRLL
ncbi:MAG TPA: spore photoproduct [Eubacterium sp.]|nr:spore photoproduct [Eubacterium sp.]